MFVYVVETKSGEVYEIGSGDSCTAAWENHAPVPTDAVSLYCRSEVDPATVKAFNDVGLVILLTVLVCMIVPLIGAIAQTLMAGRQQEAYALQERRRIREEKRLQRQRENERFYRQFR